MLVGMRSALGFGQAITEPSAGSLLGDYYPPEQRGKAFSIQQVMLLAGTGLGVALGGGLGRRLQLAGRPARRRAARPARRRARVPACASRSGAPPTSWPPSAPAPIEHADDDEHPKLFEHGFRQFLRDMVAGLRADMRTIMSIRTMRYALVGVAALLFTITAIAAWLPQYYERHLHFAEGAGEAMFGLLAVLGGVPGVLLGGRVADRWAPTHPGRPARPAGDLHLRRHDAASPRRTCSGPTPGATEVDWSVAGPAFVLQLLGMFIMTMAIPGLRAGLTDAIPAHLRGAGFGAFNLVAVVFGAAAAPFIVGALSDALRREPAGGVPARHAAQLHRRRHPLPGPQVTSTRT